MRQEDDLVDAAALETAQEKLEAQLAQPPGDFQGHHSLEAADALESSLRDAARSLGSQLQSVAQAAQSLEKNDTSLTLSARQQLESDLQSAVEGIRSSSMGTSDALQQQLNQLDPAKLTELDQEQMKK